MRIFTRKHYIKVAKILKACEPIKDFSSGETFNHLCGKVNEYNTVVKEFSQAFQADSDKFDLNKFQKACCRS